ncbi:hypothetical protein [Sporomusa sphaeroides]|uniref:Uncharacterized protein n=1 Tax=Sporomusa sphaeroides DSM 2875 TaxID=1337886 RepID=A0ABP2C4W8_9FIRM|nr:hypothetical protein [Sporomusa sphaeroides]OLS56329.1 hypothetical protein SPSPH_27220 [Sporomusa sphaeroides DSM 2875]CVK18424.1 hypothetical protein SSPH_01062 [Sporomusa sphaeroides DSM 2875]
MNSNSNTNVIVEGINYCFSRRVDSQSLKIAHDLLKSMNLSESDINTVIFMFAATCAKHYKHGYLEARDTTKQL